jgi:heat shock protein HtpX
MAICLILLGYIIGFAFFGQNGAFIGLIIATAVWLILMMISFSGGDQILLAASRAKPVTHDVHPQLFNIVEEMKIAAGLPAMPPPAEIPNPLPSQSRRGFWQN